MWLEKLFGDKPVPSYELNQYTVGVLHNLKKRNELKEADTQLLIEDLRQKADEYNAEGTIFISSPEYNVLMVSYCDQSLSVVRCQQFALKAKSS